MAFDIEWNEKLLGEVSSNHDGKRKPVKQSDRNPGPYPYYGASGIVDYVDDYLFDGLHLLIAEDGENLRTKQTPIAFLANGKCWVNNHAHIVTGGEEVSTRYLHYYFQTVDIQPYITGAVMPKLNQANLNLIPVKYPDVAYQKKIEHLLGTLDDKIDLNRRQNATLEAMAQAIFKDWFVDFGPVRAKMEGREAYLPEEIWQLFPDRLDEDGGKPEGWKLETLGDNFNLTMGQSPKGDTYNDDGDGLPFFQGRTDFGFRYPSNRKYCTDPKRLASAEDTLVSVRAPVGDINMASEKCCIGRGVAAIRHKSGARGFTYYSLRQIQKELQSYESEGTVFGSINKKQFSALSFLKADGELIDAFERQIASLDDKVSLNTKETINLSNLRDTLLPKLISGELRIPDAEQVVEESV
ncbi:Type I restriction modification DNA specificity domain [Halomonadaceae bacterium LMG 33818]|uniref:restriction endonuclease subunit S n=1 Tax=Cernens ardua TaxID=3402176 RepID=UPI003EDC3AA1